MPEMISISREEKEHLEERVAKTALDKSYLQLIIRLMNRIGATSGLDNLIDNLLHGIVDVIGGLNIILYYRVDGIQYYTDVYGRKGQLANIDDPLVQQACDSRTTLEIEHEFSDTKMATAQFGRGYTWVVPLQVGPDLVGVLKLERLNIAMRELYQQLPTFFNYTALVLKNEIQNYALLKNSCELLQAANRQLSDEISQRKRAEEALRRLNEELEQRVMERTTELYDANRLLEEELGERQKAQAALQEQAAILAEEVEERRRAEESLESTRQKLHLILESVSEGICSVDTDGEITLFNSFGAKTLGWEKEELSGKDHHALVHHKKSSGAPYPEAECPVHATLKDGETHRICDEIFWRKDGTSLPVEYVSTPIMEGGAIVGAVLNFRDITERKRAEAEILHLKNYLANIIDSMPSLLVGIDTEQRVVLWNRQAESMTGIVAADAVGGRIGQLLPEFSPWIESLRTSEQERQPSGMEKLLLEQNGVRSFYDLMRYPLVANGVEGAVIRIEDVTERTRVQSLMVQTEKMMSKDQCRYTADCYFRFRHRA
jgi:PAS domain S-box-containing protein